ncbi:MAG: hypothetical protein J4O06_13660 [Chloroflexi bacterium]|nr:hypothetical protein [Chloroflexota bacterium]
MMTSRVIRVDEEVWAELQRRAIPFEDNPNSVIRRELGLPNGRINQEQVGRKDKMEERILKLLALVQSAVGEVPQARQVESGQSVRFDGRAGKVRAYIYSQKRRLKVETSKQMAEEAGIDDWDYELKNGWFNTGISSVFWYVSDGEDDAYQRVAVVLAKLWKV